MDSLYPVILAGGVGARLWPLSRQNAPKFLHDLTGEGNTLLEQTFDRVAGFGPVTVVTGVAQADKVLELLPEARVIVEPSPKDSTAAIGLAAATLVKEDPNAVLAVFPSDHIITGEGLFQKAIRRAYRAAKRGQVVTVGVPPRGPATSYGYIKPGKGLGACVKVEGFVEKPSKPVARGLLVSHLWNTGIYVAKASTILEAIRDYSPTLCESLLLASESMSVEVWDRVEAKAFDYAVSERKASEGLLSVVVGRFLWDDVGDFDALASWHGEELTVLGDHVVAEKTTGLVLSNSGRLVTVLGLDDVVVVDTVDALLVTTRSNAQAVKGLVSKLRAGGHNEV